MQTVHRILHYLEFALVLLIGFVATGITLFFGSQLIDESELIWIFLSLVISLPFLFIAGFIVGTFAFGDPKTLTTGTWKFALTGVAISGAALLLFLANELFNLGLSGDNYLYIPILAMGSLLIPPFLHCHALREGYNQRPASLDSG